MFDFRLPKKLYLSARAKADKVGWSFSGVCRRLMQMKIKGRFRIGTFIGRPRLFRQKAEMIRGHFKLSPMVKEAFEAEAKVKDCDMSALLTRLLDYWVDDLIGTDEDGVHSKIPESKMVKGESAQTFTLLEASTTLGVSMPTVRKHIQREKQRGSSLRITPEELETLRQLLAPRA